MGSGLHNCPYKTVSAFELTALSANVLRIQDACTCRGPWSRLFTNDSRLSDIVQVVMVWLAVYVIVDGIQASPCVAAS